MYKNLSLGYDLGSSFIKAAIIDIDSGELVANTSYPSEEMKIHSPQVGFAEQHPEDWWNYIKILTRYLLSKNNIDGNLIKSIGISYQMHGLVVVDKMQKVLRPSLIWCDSRAVNIGNNAFNDIGAEYCLSNLLNSPGNFTASKLFWIKQNEPEVYNRICKFMLPGDFIAMKLTGEITTTQSGLSEGIFWDFKKDEVSSRLLNYFEFDKKLISEIVPTFGLQGKLTKQAAEQLGIDKDTPVTYRAGDQPNNAFSLNVMKPGEIAATAGTSGVVYGIIDKPNYDKLSRVNQFIHVNHSEVEKRIGVLLCINGTGIMNSWVKKNFASKLSYEKMNELAGSVSPGSDGVVVLPFGNGAERVLENKNIGSHFLGLNLNMHHLSHVLRAVQEGIAFSFKYGIDIMSDMGMEFKIIRAGHANMFLSDVFSQTLANVSETEIELFNVDGAQGAARAAAFGAGYYDDIEMALSRIKKVKQFSPISNEKEKINDAYNNWLFNLNKFLNS